MRDVFADTFYWLAVVNTKDPSHGLTLATPVAGRLVTTWPVLFEVMDALSDCKVRPLAAAVWNELWIEPDVEIVPLDRDLLQRAVTLFSERPDKNWSLTDCCSFVVMRDRGLSQALTGDRHFEQAGFQAIFRATK